MARSAEHGTGIGIGRSIGLVTIGHSLRDDLFPEVIAHLPVGTVIHPSGALDPLDESQLESLVSGYSHNQPG